VSNGVSDAESSAAPCRDEVTVTDGDLHETVAAHHRRVDISAWEDVYVVGDVHGCLRELRDLLATLDPGSRDLVLFVGDLVRKGPDSAGVVDLVRSRENLVSIRGNNEDKLIHDRKTLATLDRDDLAYLRSLPVAVSWDDEIAVHGGVDPRRPLADQPVAELLTRRAVPQENGYDGPFWFETYRRSPRVFFGHTVLDEPVVTDHAVGLDTGCVYGGSLTAYDYRADELVSVPARETYRERPARKVVET
jgi:serine/threonine protein phosphatase 1